ncbi:hypothetical protein Tco_0104736, partial [Tanacetum coccineum]
MDESIFVTSSNTVAITTILTGFDVVGSLTLGLAVPLSLTECGKLILSTLREQATQGWRENLVKIVAESCRSGLGAEGHICCTGDDADGGWDHLRYEHVAMNLDTLGISCTNCREYLQGFAAALAVLITGVSQSRQH